MDENVKMRATPEWMARNYDEMNKWLFGGQLGPCHFGIFTTGKGSQGKTLGHFRLAGYGLKAERYGRRLYQNNWGEKTYINKKNFYDICQPTIELNGHYIGTEESLLATLVHEMCHYYTQMYGYYPKRSHGVEFMEIAGIVSNRSNGRFSIQRVATAEEMNGYELDAGMQAIRDKRVANKKSKIMAIAVLNANDSVELTTTSSQDLVRKIYSDRSHKQTVKKIYLSKDPELIEKLFSLGFTKNMRSWRYWEINPIKLQVMGGPYFMENYENDVLFDNPEYEDDRPNTEKLSVKRQPVQQPPQKNQVFLVRTARGTLEVPFNGSYDALKEKLREVFPKISDENLDRLIQNKASYRVAESLQKIDYHRIITESINKVLFGKM